MKLSDIIVETWVDKYSEAVLKYLKPGVSLDQFMNAVSNDIGIPIIGNIDPNIPDNMAGGASAMKIPPDAAQQMGLPPGTDVIIQLSFGPKVNEKTKVTKIDGLLTRLRHEAGHGRQHRDPQANTDMMDMTKYINPNEYQLRGPTDPTILRYQMQAVERPQFVNDVADYLSQVNITPEQYKVSIKRIATEALIPFVKKLETLKYEKDIQKAGKELDTLMEKILFTDNNVNVGLLIHLGKVNNEAIMMLLSQSQMIASLYAFVRTGGVTQMSTDEEKQEIYKIRNQVESFFRSLRKNYRRMKGYNQAIRKKLA